MLPSGDQSDWASSSGSNTACRRPPPSGFMVQMSPVVWAGPDSKVLKAMRPLTGSAAAEGAATARQTAP